MDQIKPKTKVGYLASSVAPMPLVLFIGEQIEMLRYLRAYLHVGGARNTDFREYKSAGLEIVDQCAAAVTTTTSLSTPTMSAAQAAPTGPVTSFGSDTYVVRPLLTPRDPEKGTRGYALG